MNASDATAQAASVEQRVTALERRVARLRGVIEALAWAAVAGPLATLLLVVKRPGGLLMSRVFNLGHVCLSALVAWAAFRISRQVFAEWPLGVHLAAGLFAVVVLGGGLELAQYYAPGEPSWWDMATDLGGGLAAMLVTAATRGSYSRAVRLALAASGLAVLALAAAPSVRDVARELERGDRFPVLATFAESERGVFVLNGGATLNARATPEGARDVLGARAPLLSLPSEPFAGVEVRPPTGDWGRYSSLHLFVHSMADKPVTMELRVHDETHDGDYGDRFNQTLLVHPGPNDVYLMMSDLERATNGRRLNLAAIEGIVLFAPSPTGPVDLFLGSWRLEANDAQP